MKKSSFLIRFIDIGLILLFGFVIISDITVRSQIELPGSNNSSGEETTNHLYFLEIKEGNRYELIETKTQLAYEEIHGLTDLEELLTSIRQDKLEDNGDVTLIIHPQEEATMQQLVDVLDICERTGIQRNINIPS